MDVPDPVKIKVTHLARLGAPQIVFKTMADRDVIADNEDTWEMLVDEEEDWVARYLYKGWTVTATCEYKRLMVDVEAPHKGGVLWQIYSTKSEDITIAQDTLSCTELNEICREIVAMEHKKKIYLDGNPDAHPVIADMAHSVADPEGWLDSDEEED